MAHRLQILLLGNGLNRAYGGCDWSEAIRKIHTNARINIEADDFSKVPYTLKVIAATGDKISDALKKEEADLILFGVENIDSIREPLQSLLQTGFDHVLTTNYSYEIERAIDSNFERKGTHKKLNISEFNKWTEGNGAEKKYLLHTYNELSDEKNTYKIWHIHGEGRKRETVVLGHHYYGELLGKIHDEVLRDKKDSSDYYKNPETVDVRSWVDAFMIGDVYILGFGLDYSEFDLWWLLNYKKCKGCGTVFYYGPRSTGESGKVSILKLLNVQTNDIGFDVIPEDYKLFYQDAIQEIKCQVSKAKYLVGV